MVANYLAKSGEEWSDTFSKQNGGTYNNQWFVVDNKLFTPVSDLPLFLLHFPPFSLHFSLLLLD